MRKKTEARVREIVRSEMSLQLAFALANWGCDTCKSGKKEEKAAPVEHRGDEKTGQYL